jgi:hypothetical protein
MASPIFQGQAGKATHVATLVIGGTWATNDTLTLTIGGASLVLTIGGTTTTTSIASDVSAAWNSTTLSSASCVPGGGGTTINQFKEITASVNSSTVTLTANTAGVPFTVSRALSSATGTATLTASATAATGPSFGDNAYNYSTGVVPANNDTLLFETGAQSLTDGLSLGAQPTTVTTMAAFTGNIGLPNLNILNSGYTYPEYRTKALTLTDNSATTTYKLGVGEGPGSNLQRFAAGAGQSIVNVFSSGTSTVTGVPSVLFTGTHASNVLNNFNGNVGVAFFPDESSVLATVRHGNGSNTQAKTYLGSGVTLTSATITVNGGTMKTNSALCTTTGSVTILAGTLEHYSGNVKTLTINNGGKFILKAGASTTLDTLVINKGGELDLSNFNNALTITGTVLIYAGAKITDPNRCLKGATAALHLVGCKISDLGGLDLGTDLTLTLS